MSPGVKSKLRALLGPLVGVVLFGVALALLRRLLGGHHYSDIVRELNAMPRERVALAIVLTAANYLVLTGYDSLALRYIRHALAYAKIAVASFIAYAFSANIGLWVLSGGSVRYRLYSGWGLSAVEVAQVVAFSAVTF